MEFLTDATIGFLIGGIIVSAFSLTGNLFKPGAIAGSGHVRAGRREER